MKNKCIMERGLRSMVKHVAWWGQRGRVQQPGVDLVDCKEQGSYFDSDTDDNRHIVEKEGHGRLCDNPSLPPSPASSLQSASPRIARTAPSRPSILHRCTDQNSNRHAGVHSGGRHGARNMKYPIKTGRHCTSPEQGRKEGANQRESLGTGRVEHVLNIQGTRLQSPA